METTIGQNRGRYYGGVDTHKDVHVAVVCDQLRPRHEAVANQNIVGFPWVKTTSGVRERDILSENPVTPSSGFGEVGEAACRSWWGVVAEWPVWGHVYTRKAWTRGNVNY